MLNLNRGASWRPARDCRLRPDRVGAAISCSASGHSDSCSGYCARLICHCFCCCKPLAPTGPPHGHHLGRLAGWGADSKRTTTTKRWEIGWTKTLGRVQLRSVKLRSAFEQITNGGPSLWGRCTANEGHFLLRPLNRTKTMGIVEGSSHGSSHEHQKYARGEVHKGKRAFMRAQR